jgi:hypothetical protein
MLQRVIRIAPEGIHVDIDNGRFGHARIMQAHTGNCKDTKPEKDRYSSTARRPPGATFT